MNFHYGHFKIEYLIVNQKTTTHGRSQVANDPLNVRNKKQVLKRCILFDTISHKIATKFNQCYEMIVVQSEELATNALPFVLRM
ncbi:hypothetical protein [Trichoplusia ni ascovirus 6b]|nr:hypothetical protein [Trichoplusia ni ascovirus 6b]